MIFWYIFVSSTAHHLTQRSVWKDVTSKCLPNWKISICSKFSSSGSFSHCCNRLASCSSSRWSQSVDNLRAIVFSEPIGWSGKDSWIRMNWKVIDFPISPAGDGVNFSLDLHRSVSVLSYGKYSIRASVLLSILDVLGKNSKLQSSSVSSPTEEITFWLLCQGDIWFKKKKKSLSVN